MTTHYASEDNGRNIGILSQTRMTPSTEADEGQVESLTVNGFVSNYFDQDAFVGVSTHAERQAEPDQVTFYVNAGQAAELAAFFATVAAKLAK